VRHLYDPSRLHIHGTRSALPPKSGFGSRIGHDAVGGDDGTLLNRQPLSLGCGLELVNEVVLRLGHYPGRIVGNERRPDDQGTSPELRIQAACEAKTNERAWAELLHEPARPSSCALLSYASLDNRQPTERGFVPVHRKSW
jgi:hypothetical protein